MSRERGLLEELRAVLESRDPDTIVAFFEQHSNGITFLPIYPYAEEIKEAKIEELDGAAVRVRIKFTAQGNEYNTSTICVDTRQGLACYPEPRRKEA